MDLNYVNKKLSEEIFKNLGGSNDVDNKNPLNKNKICIFSLYEGYDIYLLIDYLLEEIKISKILGNIYMVNFSDYFIKLMNNNYNNTIETMTSKNKKRDRRTHPFATLYAAYPALPAVPVVARKGINA